MLFDLCAHAGDTKGGRRCWAQSMGECSVAGSARRRGRYGLRGFTVEAERTMGIREGTKGSGTTCTTDRRAPGSPILFPSLYKSSQVGAFGRGQDDFLEGRVFVGGYRVVGEGPARVTGERSAAPASSLSRS